MFAVKPSRQLDAVREQLADWVDADRTVVLHEDGQTRWFTWAGGRANAVLHAAPTAVAATLCDPDKTFTNDHVVLRADASASELGEALTAALARFGTDLAGVEPEITRRAIQDLKFGDLLPTELAERTLAGRLADHGGAAAAAARGRLERWGND